MNNNNPPQDKAVTEPDSTDASKPETRKSKANKPEPEITEAEIIEEEERETLAERFTTPEHWLRLLFMILFALILVPATYVMGAVVVFQFVWFMLSGERNDKLHNFGHSLVVFIHQALTFLNFNTEEKPFPFKDWPEP